MRSSLTPCPRARWRWSCPTRRGRCSPRRCYTPLLCYTPFIILHPLGCTPLLNPLAALSYTPLATPPYHAARLAGARLRARARQGAGHRQRARAGAAHAHRLCAAARPRLRRQLQPPAQPRRRAPLRDGGTNTPLVLHPLAAPLSGTPHAHTLRYTPSLHPLATPLSHTP